MTNAKQTKRQKAAEKRRKDRLWQRKKAERAIQARQVMK